MCTSITAGRKASADGLTVVARNEDFTRNNWNKYLAYRDAGQYAQPDTPSQSDGLWTLGNGLAVSTPAVSHPYSAMPDAVGASEASHTIGDHFFFEERGVNARNVAVSATNSMAANERARTADPFVTPGVAESVIPTLILPQAESARHGVELLGAYVEAHGAGEPNGVQIADPRECWYLEIGSGHHWIAVRVPDDQYVVVANDMRVHEVDLDSDAVLHSAGLYEFVRRHRLLDRPERHRFDFAQAFGILGLPYNVDRVWLAQLLLSPSRQQAPREQRYPLFLTPDKPLHVTDVMQVLRATYAGTVLDGKADRPIGFERTAESHIITLNAAAPAELAALIWQTVSTPLGAPYMPLRAAMTHVPVVYSRGANEFSPFSAYWAFHSAHTLQMLTDPADEAPDPWWREFEQRCVEQAPWIDALLATAFTADPAGALDLAERDSVGIAGQAFDLATTTAWQVLTEIASGHAHEHAMAISADGGGPGPDS